MIQVDKIKVGKVIETVGLGVPATIIEVHPTIKSRFRFVYNLDDITPWTINGYELDKHDATVWTDNRHWIDPEDLGAVSCAMLQCLKRINLNDKTSWQVNGYGQHVCATHNPLDID